MTQPNPGYTRYTIDYDCGGKWRVRAQQADIAKRFRFVAESAPGAMLPRKQVASVDCLSDDEAIEKAKSLANDYSLVDG